jgi:hypothetical protein
MVKTAEGPVAETNATSQQGAAVAAPSDPLLELEVMHGVAEQLKRLQGDIKAVRRVLQWAGPVFGVADEPAIAPALRPQRVGSAAAASTPSSPDAIVPTFETLPDFYSAAGPARETDKALVVGYWVQVIQGTGEFDAFTINKELRHLGYAVANITSAFDNLINRKPQLVIQTRKSGTSRQARKMYKLTMEGQRAVERMLGDGQE